MAFLEPYLSSVEKSRFLLIAESGADPRVLYRYDPEGGCLLVQRILDEAPAQALLYGSVPFTLTAGQRPLRAALTEAPGLCPGSALWCEPVGLARFSGRECLLLVRPDRALCPASGARDGAAPERWEPIARSYAEYVAEIDGASLTFGTRREAEAEVERGLENYRLSRHFRNRRC